MNILKKFWNRKFIAWHRSIQSKNPTLAKMLWKFKFDQGIRTIKIYRIYNYIRDEKHLLHLLPKEVVRYDTYQELSFDLKIIAEFKRFREGLNNEEYFPDYVAKYIRRDKKLLNYCFENGHAVLSAADDTKMYTKFSKKLKEIGVDLPDLNVHEYNKKLKELLECKDKYGRHFHLAYQNDKELILIAEINRYDVMRELGAGKWCIVQSHEHWDNYVKDGFSQFIIWDYNVLPSHGNHCFGVTINDQHIYPVHIFDHFNEKRNSGVLFKYLLNIKERLQRYAKN